MERALEAVEAAYAKRGYKAVRVLLPEQELEKGTVRFHVVESRFGKVAVKDNHFVSAANALNAADNFLNARTSYDVGKKTDAARGAYGSDNDSATLPRSRLERSRRRF